MSDLDTLVAKLPQKQQERIEERTRELLALNLGMRYKVWPKCNSFAPQYVRRPHDVIMVEAEFPDHTMLHKKLV